MNMSSGLLADVRVREGEERGEHESAEAGGERSDEPRCSAEPLIETDKYRIAVPTFRPEELHEGFAPPAS